METAKPQVRILHLSDLHFGPPYVAEVGQAVLKIAPELAPDALVVSGDFTQRARREQFAAAQSFLQQLPNIPRLFVPGNHDVPLLRIRERIATPHGLYQQYISSDLNPVLALEHAVIVGIDSTAPRRAISNGRIHDWQLQAAQQVFSEAPRGAARIVVAHHHFAPAPDYLRDSTMPKAKRAIMRFVENDVDMILGGHLHRAYVGNTLDVYPGIHRDRGIVVVQSGTSTSRRGRGREREKNSFNLICISEQTIQVTHYLYFDADAGFVPSSQHLFPRGIIPLPPSCVTSHQP